MATSKTTKKPAASAPQKRTSKAAVTSSASDETLDLDQLAEALGAPSDAIAELVLSARDDEGFLALGTSYASEDILASITPFLGMAKAQLEALDPKGRKLLVGVSKSVLALGAREALTLRETFQSFTQSSPKGAATRRANLRAVTSESVLLRDQIYGAISASVPSTGPLRDKVNAGVGTADSPEQLAGGLVTVAGLVVRVRKGATAAARAAYDELGITAEVAVELKKKAAQLRAANTEATKGADPKKRIDQRTLDMQDGRVLHVVQHLYRAFREAHHRQATILMPPLGRMKRLSGNFRTGKPASNPVEAP